MSLTYSVSQFSPPPLPTYLTKNRHTIRNVTMVLIALLKSYPLTMVPSPQIMLWVFSDFIILDWMVVTLSRDPFSACSGFGRLIAINKSYRIGNNCLNLTSVRTTISQVWQVLTKLLDWRAIKPQVNSRDTTFQFHNSYKPAKNRFANISDVVCHSCSLFYGFDDGMIRLFDQ